MCVTGFVHPDHLWKNIGALPGDRLILTKPVGTGILTTALKADFLSRDEGQEVIRVMSWLNKYARDAVADLEIHACTGYYRIWSCRSLS